MNAAELHKHLSPLCKVDRQGGRRPELTPKSLNPQRLLLYASALIHRGLTRQNAGLQGLDEGPVQQPLPKVPTYVAFGQLQLQFQHGSLPGDRVNREAGTAL